VSNSDPLPNNLAHGVAPRGAGLWSAEGALAESLGKPADASPILNTASSPSLPYLPRIVCPGISLASHCSVPSHDPTLGYYREVDSDTETSVCHVNRPSYTVAQCTDDNNPIRSHLSWREIVASSMEKAKTRPLTLAFPPFHIWHTSRTGIDRHVQAQSRTLGAQRAPNMNCLGDATVFV
jgi:hypothetical protein